MSINLILATDESGGLGLNNNLLFVCPKDMSNFYKQTTGKGNNTVVMGRNTFQSLPKPLRNRHNIILTRDENFKVNSELHNNYSIEIKHSLHDVLEDYRNSSQEGDCWIIGGAEIYRQSILDVDKVYLTLFHHSREHDVKFNLGILDKYFKVVKKEEMNVDGLSFDFITYMRKEDAY